MSIAPEDLLNFAIKIAADPNPVEASSRTAICRAYYAAYHQSESWYQKLPSPGSLGLKNPKGMHDRFFVLLSNPNTTDNSASQCSASRRRGYALRLLHDCRTRADYDLQASVTAAEVTQAISDAQGIISIT